MPLLEGAQDKANWHDVVAAERSRFGFQRPASSGNILASAGPLSPRQASRRVLMSAHQGGNAREAGGFG
jgi:hypothetical protein